jgi:hypothetical protein
MFSLAEFQHVLTLLFLYVSCESLCVCVFLHFKQISVCLSILVCFKIIHFYVSSESLFVSVFETKTYVNFLRCGTILCGML